MRIICSWCRREGEIGLVGEKPPLEDLRETHCICETHHLEVQARWKKSLRVSGGTRSDRPTAGSQSRRRRPA